MNIGDIVDHIDIPHWKSGEVTYKLGSGSIGVEWPNGAMSFTPIEDLNPIMHKVVLRDNMLLDTGTEVIPWIELKKRLK